MDRPLTLPELALEASARFGSRPALSQLGVSGWTLSFEELATAMRACAEELRSSGLETGDRLGLVLPASPDWVVSVLGAQCLGASVVPLDPGEPEERLDAALHALGVRAVVASGRKLSVESWMPSSSRELRRDASGASPPGALAEDEALVLHTSGTESEPTPVSLSHRAFLAEARACRNLAPPRLLRRGLAFIPPWHVLGFNLLVPMALQAGTHVAFPVALEAEAIRQAFRSHRPTVIGAVPSIAERLVEAVDAGVAARPRPARAAIGFARRLTSRLPGRLRETAARVLLAPLRAGLGGRLGLVISSGAALSESTRSRMRSLGLRVIEAYGLTETCGAVSATRPPRSSRGAAGLPLPGVELLIEAADALGFGELQVRTPTLASGLPVERFAGDWFRTGDLARLENDGSLRIAGRRGEGLVSSSGLNVLPAAIERALGSLPGVEELAVCRRGPRDADGLALVLRTPSGGSPDLRRALARSIARLPPQERPRAVRLTEQPLPRSATGKLLRRDLSARLDDATWGRGLAGSDAKERCDSPLTARVLSIASRALGRRPSLDASLSLELGLDSLTRLGLVAEIERSLSVRLDEEARSAETVAELVELTERARRAAPQTELRPPAPEELAELDRLRLSSRLARPLTEAVHALLHPPTVWVWSLQVSGRDRLPSAGPAIFCANHASVADSFLVPHVLPRRLRAGLIVLGHDGFHAGPLRSGFLRAFGGLAIDNLGDPLPGLRVGLRVLEEGGSLLLYPEGRRSIDGTLGPFADGAALLALASGAPLVPVRIAGSGDAMPIGARWPRLRRHDGSRVRVSLEVGEVIPVERQEDACWSTLRKAAPELTQRLRLGLGGDIAAPLRAVGEG